MAELNEALDLANDESECLICLQACGNATRLDDWGHVQQLYRLNMKTRPTRSVLRCAGQPEIR